MKKFVIFLLIIVMLPIAVFATSYQSLYTLDIPYAYQGLILSGNFGGGEALNITIDTSPTVTFAANASVNGNYFSVNHSDDTHMNISSSGSYVEVGSTGISVNARATGDYKKYAFSLGSMPAFYQVLGSGTIFFNQSFAGGGTTFNANLRPTVGAGIGKIYQIQTIKSILNTMDYFGITPTEEMVEKIARIEYSRNERLNAYSDNDALLWSSFQNELASAYGVEEKIVEFVYRNSSQVYSFENQRWANLLYGWQAFAQLRPTFFFETGTTNTFTFTLGIALGGQWATLLSNESIYVSVYGEVVPTINTSATKILSFVAEANVDARYFFPNPKMWVDSSLTIDVNTNWATKLDIDFDAIFNYMIAPNFTAFGGLEMNNTFDTMSIVAGGEMRLF